MVDEQAGASVSTAAHTRSDAAFGNDAVLISAAS
jgi:hypothetical protein